MSPPRQQRALWEDTKERHSVPIPRRTRYSIRKRQHSFATTSVDQSHCQTPDHEGSHTTSYSENSPMVTATHEQPERACPLYWRDQPAADETKMTVNDSLLKWAIECNVPKTQMSKLLKALHPHFPELPLSASALIRSPIKSLAPNGCGTASNTETPPSSPASVPQQYSEAVSPMNDSHISAIMDGLLNLEFIVQDGFARLDQRLQTIEASLNVRGMDEEATTNFTVDPYHLLNDPDAFIAAHQKLQSSQSAMDDLVARLYRQRDETVRGTVHRCLNYLFTPSLQFKINRHGTYGKLKIGIFETVIKKAIHSMPQHNSATDQEVEQDIRKQLKCAAQVFKRTADHFNV